MKSIAKRLAFKPELLPKASLKVVALHPSSGRRLPKLDVLSEDSLWERIREAAGDRGALHALADGLSNPELRAIATGLVQWLDLRSDLEVMLDHRCPRRLSPVLWGNLEAEPANEPSQRLLRKLITLEGKHLWPPASWHEEARRWLHQRPLVPRITAWAGREGHGVTALPALYESPFSRGTPLLRALLEQVLIAGDKAAISREPARDRKACWHGLSPDARSSAGANYLVKVSEDAWEEWVLDEIEDSFGLPGSERSRAAFWKPIPDDIQQAFRVRQLSKKLDAFFVDHERLDYWKSRWLQEMRDMRQARAGGTPYAVLEFGKFGVVEFMEVGNAAYFYYTEDLKAITKGWATHPSDLKEQKSYAVDGFYTDNRLLHHQGWQYRADSRMRRWLKLNG
jgi:hypothetical protein